MKKILLLIFVCSQLAALAQKQKNEKIEYYTDSEVKRSIVSLQLGYMPYYTNRRLLANSINPSPGFYFLNSSVTGQYGQAYGGDLLFKLGKYTFAGVGLYNSFSNYRWDFVKILDQVNGNGDTLDGTFNVDVKANYLNLPIQFGYSSQLTDQLYLQVVPALEINFLQQLQRLYQIDDPNLRPENSDEFGDITSKGTQINLTINFGLGAEYRFAEKMGLFARLQFRYMFFEVEQNTDINEVIYTIGGHMGVRYYF